DPRYLSCPISFGSSVKPNSLRSRIMIWNLAASRILRSASSWLMFSPEPGSPDGSSHTRLDYWWEIPRGRSGFLLDRLRVGASANLRHYLYDAPLVED